MVPFPKGKTVLHLDTDTLHPSETRESKRCDSVSDLLGGILYVDTLNATERAAGWRHAYASTLTAISGVTFGVWLSLVYRQHDRPHLSPRSVT